MERAEEIKFVLGERKFQLILDIINDGLIQENHVKKIAIKMKHGAHGVFVHQIKKDQKLEDVMRFIFDHWYNKFAYQTGVNALEELIKIFQDDDVGLNLIADSLKGSNEASAADKIDLKQRGTKDIQLGPFPTKIVVRSDGLAARHHPSSMGLYTRGHDLNGRPSWINETGRIHLYYTKDGFWKMSSNPQKGTGKLRSSNVDLNKIPTNGWLYYLDGAGWLEDTYMTVQEHDEVWPNDVIVIGNGPAKEKWPEYFGAYRKVEGPDTNERPIFNKVNDSTKIMFYSKDRRWMIGDKLQMNPGKIQSKKTGLVDIPMTGWMFSDSDGWHEAHEISFISSKSYKYV